MLTKDQALFEYRNNRVYPDRLSRKNHAHYVDYAEKMIGVYRSGIGKTRRELHQNVHNILANEGDCPVRRIEAFCKLLDDKKFSTFDEDRKGNAWKLRRQVFRLGAPSFPLVREPDQLFDSSEKKVKELIALTVGKSWEEIDQNLFTDIIDFQVLKKFEGLTAMELLSKYNVAQAQATLYGALEMQVRIRSDFKVVLKYAKLARLMHTIRRIADDDYEIIFDGPVSVLRRSRRYGVGMAKFFPALLVCAHWSMKARIETMKANWYPEFILSSTDGYTGNIPPEDEFDSSLEAKFSAKWGDKPREGWSMGRENVILHHGQKVFLPDFVFRHEDGTEICLEIVGFWTPEYLQAKRETIRLFQSENILLAVGETLAKDKTYSDPHTIIFKNTLKITDVLLKLTGLRNRKSFR